MWKAPQVEKRSTPKIEKHLNGNENHLTGIEKHLNRTEKHLNGSWKHQIVIENNINENENNTSTRLEMRINSMSWEAF